MRANLSTDLSDALRQAIVHGDLAAGERIDEGAWAEEWDVSRTPLREALSRLVAEGFVESRPRRGFFVRDVGPREVRDLYAIRAILDPAALAAAGLPDAGRLERLERLNAEIAAASGDVERTIDLDDAWHLALLSHGDNRTLLDLVERFMRRTRPLERAYAGSHGTPATMVEEHARILAALRAGDLEAAVERLRENMRSGLGPILEWLETTRAEPVGAVR